MKNTTSAWLKKNWGPTISTLLAPQFLKKPSTSCIFHVSRFAHFVGNFGTKGV